MKRTEVLNFRLDPGEALEVKRFARSQGLSFTDLCRGAIFQVIKAAEDDPGFVDLPDDLDHEGDEDAHDL